MSGLATAVPVRGGAGWAWIVIVAGLVGGVVVMGASTPDAQMFMALTAIIAVLGVLLIPRMARRDGLISGRFLGVALTAHIVGSLLRFIIIQAVYHGVADANGYYGAGVQLAPLFRSLQFPVFPHPGTAFMNFCTGLLFAITGPTMLGGFVVCAALGFVGSWFFYKAFRVSFPEGDARLFSLLIFLLPSMWYWPSSLGKDGLIVLFLGIATYGFALILRGRFVHGFWVAAWGTAGTIMIRPPMAAALVVAAAAAVLLRPARARSIQVQALLYLVLVPVLVVMSAVTIQSARTYIHSDDPVAAFEAQQSQTFGQQGGGSNFSASSPFTPRGLPIAIITVNFRPFPYEAGGVLPAIASLEGVVLLWLVFRRRHQMIAGLRAWHSNGMVILAFLAWFSFSVILSSLPNFGLLARQRTQALPYLFMLLAMVPRPARRLARREAAAAKDDPELVATGA
jgi:hypothetical protein